MYIYRSPGEVVILCEPLRVTAEVRALRARTITIPFGWSSRCARFARARSLAPSGDRRGARASRAHNQMHIFLAEYTPKYNLEQIRSNACPHSKWPQMAQNREIHYFTIGAHMAKSRFVRASQALEIDQKHSKWTIYTSNMYICPGNAS
jgi:hypothetical protein